MYELLLNMYLQTVLRQHGTEHRWETQDAVCISLDFGVNLDVFLHEQKFSSVVC